MIARRWFRRRLGQDVRAWPMLALLLLIVLVAVGCVQWFMREAMRNERLAVREKLAEAYRGQLAFIVKRTEERWPSWLAQLAGGPPDAAHFAAIVEKQLAASALLLDGSGRVVYPRPALAPDAASAQAGEGLQAELRRLLQAGDKDAAAAFVLEKFADSQSAIPDAQGRLVAPNAELLALELLADKADPRFIQIADRMRRRVLAYDTTPLPSAQRVFLMHRLQRLLPGPEFPTLAAEELASRFLEAQAEPEFPTLTASDFAARFFDTPREPAGGPELRLSELRGVWVVAAPGHQVLALLTTAGLRTRLEEMTRDSTLPAGVSITVLAPGEDTASRETLAIAGFGAGLPGWRLALSLGGSTPFDAAADQRVRRYLVIGSLVTAAMSVLTILIARGFGRQVRLARLKNDLVATVSHELKTPLTAMRALVETLLDAEQFDATTTREYLQLVARENARLSRLIDNFLTFSRLERGKFTFAFTRLPPRAVVEGALAAFGDRAQAPGCQLETHLAEPLPEIVGDLDALVTALLNLLDNAWKYSGDQKRLAVRVEARERAVCFSVADHGIGLSPVESRRIFQRFYQVDQRLARTASGCGLGLSIVQSIVTAHGGAVRVASQPGRGSTFTLELPAAP